VSAIIEKLTRLGFSQYEARVYVGLVTAPEPLTGYAVANVTGVPQPKVYETLRRLDTRGVVARTSGEPARYVAVAVERVLGELEASFEAKLREAREELESLRPQAFGELPGEPWRLAGREAILARAEALVAGAQRGIYLSGRSSDLAGLEEPVTAACARGVEVVMLHFGRRPFAVPDGATYAHVSTDGRLYRKHQARHLGVVADTHATLWAVAPDGRAWQGVALDHPVMAAALKGYIRHDIYLQRIFGDLGSSLTELYGLDLEGLTELVPAARLKLADDAASA
jgi:sugar-specific transcriptional regulator TrmB